jgi:hypothetical protein
MDRKSEQPLVQEQELDEEETDAASALLELVAAGASPEPDTPKAAPERIDGIVIARLVAIDGPVARVDFPGNWSSRPLAARSLVALGAAHVGREVALAFELGRPESPIVTGVIQHLETPAGTVVVDAERDLVLRCGKASITLTRAGKIVIRGEYLLSRATGVHRIQGGAVEIN